MYRNFESTADYLPQGTELFDDIETVMESNEAPTKDIVLQQLETASTAEQRVGIFATFADKYGIEAMISLIPAYGDAASAVLSTTYLLFEAKRLDMPFWSRFKIIMNSLIDFALGLVPVVGDVADFFHHSNVKSAKYFTELVDELVVKAQEAGASEQEIEAILRSKRNVTGQINNVVTTFAAVS